MRYFASVTFLCFAVVTTVFAQADLKKLDAYYSKALADWAVPGMSIAIVKDGQIVFSKGYGVKEIGKPGKPDAKSLFAIASNTKTCITDQKGYRPDGTCLSIRPSRRVFGVYRILCRPLLPRSETRSEV